jgi:hypothetical protein
MKLPQKRMSSRIGHIMSAGVEDEEVTSKNNSIRNKEEFMAAPQGLTPEFAANLRQLMLDGLMRELETTKKVLKAVPDAKSDYRPDPYARTAWELAWHIANTDVQFLNGIPSSVSVCWTRRLRSTLVCIRTISDAAPLAT